MTDAIADAIAKVEAEQPEPAINVRLPDGRIVTIPENLDLEQIGFLTVALVEIATGLARARMEIGAARGAILTPAGPRIVR